MKTKHILRALINTGLNFVLALLFITAVNSVLGADINPINIASIVAVVSFSFQTVSAMFGYKSVKGLAFFALQTEVWIEDIQENLYSENPFLNFAKDHSMYIENKTVHVPQAGASPTVVKNRSVFPGTITQRTDTDLTYDMMNFTAEPTLITNLEELQINYAKRTSVMENYFKQLVNTAANQILYAWAPAGSTRIVKTTGAASSAALPHSTATGTRLAITLTDIAKAKAKLDKDKVPSAGRILLMPSDMYNSELLAISNIQQFYSYNSEVLKTGVAGFIFGFQVMIRPDVFVYDSSNVIQAIDDAGEITTPATGDFNACLAYHPSFVSKAIGTIMPYYNPDKAEYYGSLFSAEMNMGGAKMRTDQKGVVAIVQAP